KPSPPVVLGPIARVTPEQTVSFTCKSHGFFPRNITLKWFKDGHELSHFQTTVDPKGESTTYSISSTAQVVLGAGDVYSQIICEVSHVTLQGGPLRGTANLSDTIQEEIAVDIKLMCQVEHERQPLVLKSHTLVISALQREQELKTSDTAEILVAVLIGPKLLLVIGASAIYMYKKQKAQ
ncbi:signal-regulatory protein beta-1-like isoform X1, partial [Cricetulus griseus]|uniref:signal-regulatory protein beta-1-like isoform X1 n=1 Tax=Cricetulus griseus TaxID=10029 RepID=UPI0015C30E0C